MQGQLGKDVIFGATCASKLTINVSLYDWFKLLKSPQNSGLLVEHEILHPEFYQLRPSIVASSG